MGSRSPRPGSTPRGLPCSGRGCASRTFRGLRSPHEPRTPTPRAPRRADRHPRTSAWRAGLAVRHVGTGHARALRERAQPRHGGGLRPLRRPVGARGRAARLGRPPHHLVGERDQLPGPRFPRRPHLGARHALSGPGAVGADRSRHHGGGRLRHLSRTVIRRVDARHRGDPWGARPGYRPLYQRRRRRGSACDGRRADLPEAVRRGRRPPAHRLGTGTRRTRLRGQLLCGHVRGKRAELRRLRRFGEPRGGAGPVAARRSLPAQRLPPAGARERDGPGAQRPPHDGRRRAALAAGCPRRVRGEHRLAVVEQRGTERLQHRELVCRRRAGAGDAAAAGRARGASPLRARRPRPQRVRPRRRHRVHVQRRARAHRSLPRAPVAQRGRPARARVDVPGRYHRPAVNVFFHTFGCKANQYDTEQVRQAFAGAGATVVDDPAAADVAVVNSCTVTGESEAKLRRFVGRLARGRPELRTVVMGCAAALDDGRIAALPSVRAVVGGADPGTVLGVAGVTPPASPIAAQRRAATGERYRALLKIQDGCDEHCTFCATTLARGANRSRWIPELIEEAKALAAHHAEIVLTGVHIGTYGQDRAADPGPSARGSTQTGVVGRDPGAPPRGQPTLGELLEALIAAVPQVRFRLSSVEATEVDDRVARLLIEAPRHLAAHLHAPLQSGSNRVLKRMGRHWYTAESYRARIEWLAERLGGVFGLGADIIAGFPGETEADHRATVALVEALPFTYLHVFPFSVRPDAPAAQLREQLPAGMVRDRARELRELGDAKQRAYRASRLGQSADGVVSGHGEGKVELLTQDYLSVYLPIPEWDGCPRCEVTVR